MSKLTFSVSLPFFPRGVDPTLQWAQVAQLVLLTRRHQKGPFANSHPQALLTMFLIIHLTPSPTPIFLNDTPRSHLRKPEAGLHLHTTFFPTDTRSPSPFLRAYFAIYLIFDFPITILLPGDMLCYFLRSAHGFAF